MYQAVFSLSNDFYAALKPLVNKMIKMPLHIKRVVYSHIIKCIKDAKISANGEYKNVNIAEFSGWLTFGKLPIITWSVVVAGQIGQQGVMARASYLHL